MAYNITADQLIDTLKDVAAENPDTVYTPPAHMSGGLPSSTCYYVHTDPSDPTLKTPGCIVGVALHRLGVPLDELQENEHEHAAAVIPRLVPGMDSRGTDFAFEIQHQQDLKKPWGEARRYAEANTGL